MSPGREAEPLCACKTPGVSNPNHCTDPLPHFKFKKEAFPMSNQL